MVYGQWADLLYLKLAGLFLCAALADLVLWAVEGSWPALMGPAVVLLLCLVYLYRRRRFRRSVQQGDGRRPHLGAEGRGRLEPRSVEAAELLGLPRRQRSA